MLRARTRSLIHPPAPSAFVRRSVGQSVRTSRSQPESVAGTVHPSGRSVAFTSRARGPSTQRSNARESSDSTAIAPRRKYDCCDSASRSASGCFSPVCRFAREIRAPCRDLTVLRAFFVLVLVAVAIRRTTLRLESI